MKLSASEPGIIVSGALHVALLVALLVTFASAQKFDDVKEAVPIETISDTEFAQMMRGEKTAKDVQKQALPKAEKVADVTETRPDPPQPPAREDVTPPPAPAPPEPPVREVRTEPPTPPVPPVPPQAAATPPAEEPPPPEPPRRPVEAAQPPAPTPPVRTPPRRVIDAEAEAPTPPVRPEPQKPPEPPKPPEVKPPHHDPPKTAEVKPPPKPKPVEKPRPDQLAKLIETPTEPTHKPAPRPKPSDSQASRWDPTDISRMLSKEAPAQKPSTARDLSRVASLGTSTGTATRMAASMWDQLDGVLEDQYKQCWSYLGVENQKYIPQIKVMYTPEGALSSEPVLINPPSDPALRSLADSAMRAVRRCNPLRIPAQFAPYYEEWKGRVLRFDPLDMAG